jgi:hypothetical protein
MIKKLKRLARLLYLARRNDKKLDALLQFAESPNYRFFRFAQPGHFYSPIPDIRDIERAANRIFDVQDKQLPGIDFNEHGQIALLEMMAQYYGELPFPEESRDGSRFYLDNGFFSYGDATVLFGMLRHFKPRRIIEVGSGFSSAAMLDVNDRFFDREIEFTFIEPYPERLLSLLQPEDQRRATLERLPVQEIPLEQFSVLEANDVLFIDSSHVARVDSDVLRLVFDILPSLNQGVIVHFHDIMWPFEYPLNWYRDGRAWNEAYLLRAFLQFNSDFEILYSNSFMASCHKTLVETLMPLALKTPTEKLTPGNTSLWLRKVA